MNFQFKLFSTCTRIFLSVRVCNDQSESSCKHSPDEVLNFSNGDKIREKIITDCEPYCDEIKEMKEEIKSKIKELKIAAQSLVPIGEDTVDYDKALAFLKEITDDDYESLLEATSGDDKKLAEKMLSDKIEDLLQKYNVDDDVQ